MSNARLELPVLQNWSCHNCGGCCREHLIEITEDEKRRIEGQKWTQADGVSMARPIIQKIGRGRYRLAHQDDGACVFLDDQGLCRIHAKFGEPAKPLACRVYPYAYHPAGRENLTVSLRFSCPSVVRNLGDGVESQRQTLATLGQEIVSGKKREHEPPYIHRGGDHGEQTVSWADFHQLLRALDESLAADDVHLVVRLMRTLSWLDLVEQSQFQTVKGEKLTEYLTLVTEASVKAQPDNDLPLQKPTRLGRTMFRLLAAQYARHDTEALVRQGWSARVGLLSAALKYATGMGSVPGLQGSASVATAFGDVPEQTTTFVKFGQLESAFDGRRADIDELLTRYFRVKVQGIHFCGPAHFDTGLVDGFRGLALMYPVVMWLARLRAARLKRTQLELTDVQAALATADHNFGYSPALGTMSSLQRVRQLAKMGQIKALTGWYSL
ncbi:MAG: YkgJ family cysteine cluster protein [Planctomycetaceae bacterium]|nr:YkgJ family cysteine cluster protein [Planctomycetaceae bacterium]